MTDWNPESYGLVNSLQQEVARRALGDLIVHGNERVLDVGCGDGRVTSMIAARLTSGSLVGVDPSEGMIEAARRRYADDSRTAYEVGTAATLPYDAAFDLVVSFNALHWETRWRVALQRIHAALVADGRAFLVFVCEGARPSLEDVTMETADSPRYREWFAGFEAPFVHVDPDEYSSAATSAGFEVEQLVVDDIDWDFGTPTAFADWCAAGMVAWTSCLPRDTRAPFVDDVVRAYATISGSAAMFRFLQCRVALAVR